MHHGDDDGDDDGSDGDSDGDGDSNGDSDGGGDDDGDDSYDDDAAGSGKPFLIPLIRFHVFYAGPRCLLKYDYKYNISSLYHHIAVRTA